MQRLSIDQKEHVPILSAPRLLRFRRDFQRLSVSDVPSVESADQSFQDHEQSRPGAVVNADPESDKQKFRLKAKFRWAVRDKEKFECLIQHLSELVRGLKEIVPMKQSVSVKLLEQDIKHVERISRLELFMHGAKERWTLNFWAGGAYSLSSAGIAP